MNPDRPPAEVRNRPESPEAYERGLPPTPKPAGMYVPVAQAGPLLFTAGHTHAIRGVLDFTGPVGAEGCPTLADARECARLAVRNCIASLAGYLDGGLEAIERVVQMTGYVAAHPDFADHPRVMDAASEELLAAFGERGRPARAALGVSSLPDRAVVEISLVVVAGTERGAGA
ncbi:RidA family protein [Sinomonas halotolerans]|uniref:RidA family protein n=1 Tax=Sinomonas halotolerans TaxID=1644133 RepID=A0ABU9WYY3_9MICC